MLLLHRAWLNADLMAKLRNGDQSIQPWYSHLTLAVTPGKAKNLDARSKLGPLPRAARENGELHPARAVGTA